MKITNDKQRDAIRPAGRPGHWIRAITLVMALILLFLGTSLDDIHPAFAIDVAVSSQNKVLTQEQDIAKDKTESTLLVAAEIPAAHTIAEFPDLLQTPELPTGCEITALTMLLRYYGLPAEKTTMAEAYLPKASFRLKEDEDGNFYGPDINRYFVGDPFMETGIVCGPGAIARAANQYLRDSGSPLRASARTGVSFEELYRMVSEDKAVVVWVTICMEDRWETQGWTTKNGSEVVWSQNDHAAVLVGYTETTITVSDPISGRREHDKSQFESVFSSRGCSCVLVE